MSFVGSAIGGLLGGPVGAIAGGLFGGGGGLSPTSTTTISLPPPSAQQGRMEALQMAFFEQQLRDLGFTIGPGGELTRTGLPIQPTQPLTPEQETQVSNIFGTQRARGQEDIAQFAAQLAGRRGLNLTDSPIGSEVLREQSRLLEGLGALESQTRLALPQQAFQNRLALMESAQGLGSEFLGGLRQQRLAQGTQFREIDDPLGQFAQLLGGVGGLLRGVGGLGGGGGG